MTPPRMKAREMKNTAERTKYALFTGAAGGLASACIGVLLEKYPEWRVFAADKDEEKLRELAGKCGERVIPVVTDVTSDAGCADCLRIVKEHTGGLDAVVNAAGIHTMASLVESDAAAVTERLAAVNLFGMMRINRIFFPLVKAARGRIIDFSSECGFEKAQPFNTPYAVTKYGVEAYTDGLRRELNFLGIKVIKIQPGSFGTGLLDQSQSASTTTALVPPAEEKLIAVFESSICGFFTQEKQQIAMIAKLAAIHKCFLFIFLLSWLIFCLWIVLMGFKDDFAQENAVADFIFFFVDESHVSQERSFEAVVNEL